MMKARLGALGIAVSATAAIVVAAQPQPVHTTDAMPVTVACGSTTSSTIPGACPSPPKKTKKCKKFKEKRWYGTVTVKRCWYV